MCTFTICDEFWGSLALSKTFILFLKAFLYILMKSISNGVSEQTPMISINTLFWADGCCSFNVESFLILPYYIFLVVLATSSLTALLVDKSFNLIDWLELCCTLTNTFTEPGGSGRPGGGFQRGKPPDDCLHGWQGLGDSPRRLQDNHSLTCFNLQSLVSKL